MAGIRTDYFILSISMNTCTDHLLRSIDRFLDLSDLRQHLEPFYSHTGRPSVDPELTIPRLRRLWTVQCRGQGATVEVGTPPAEPSGLLGAYRLLRLRCSQFKLNGFLTIR